jgi:hypothetical protein
MGGDDSVVRPAALASLACLLVNLWLLRRLAYLQWAGTGAADSDPASDGTRGDRA